MRALRAAGLVLVALALQTTLAHAVMGNRAAFDLVLVVVLYLALAAGPTAGMLMGATAGLVQDGLSGGIIGVGSLAKTIVGFGAGVAGSQFIVTGMAPRAVVFFLGSLAHAGFALGMYHLIDPRGVTIGYRGLVAQALLNTVIGVFAFYVVERFPDWLMQRRLRRASVRRRWSS